MGSRQSSGGTYRGTCTSCYRPKRLWRPWGTWCVRCYLRHPHVLRSRATSMLRARGEDE